MRLRGLPEQTVRVSTRPTDAERDARLPGDDLVAPADVVMDRAFSLPAPPEAVWPWLVQLGKRRAGWYLPRAVERLVPPRRRALRRLDPALQGLAVGDVIPDWGGRDATFTVAALDPPHTLLHTSTRGRTRLTWCLHLTPEGTGTRLHLRLRLAPVRRRWLAEHVGGAFDQATVAGLAAGLRERVQPRRSSSASVRSGTPVAGVPAHSASRRRAYGPPIRRSITNRGTAGTWCTTVLRSASLAPSMSQRPSKASCEVFLS